MTMSPYDVDPAVLNDLVEEMRSALPVTVELLPSEAMAVVGLLQLALRHPEVSGNTAAIGRGFIRSIAESFGPVFATVVEAGWGS